MVERKYQFMIEYVHKIIEYVIFSLYLFFIFLSVQIWFIWKDINKEDFKINTFINESFFKKSCIYVFSFCVFFMGHEILEETSIAYAMLYFELLEMLGFICIVLFAYDWYSVLRLSINKKFLPHELPEFAR